MIITRLAVEGVGKFRTRHTVEGLGPGLNLLCAPNEAGKSTIFRALRACLFYRHGTADKEIASLKSLNAELPVSIEVGFEQDGIAYTVQKSFLQSRGAKLFRTGQLVADGRSADEALWSVLGVNTARGAADDSTFGLLWVRQGTSFDTVETSDDARSTLNRLIEAEVGQVLGGERGKKVFQYVEGQLGPEETKRDRRPAAGSTWKAAIDAVKSTRENLGKSRETLSLLEADFTALAQRLDEQDTISDPAALARMQADLEAAVQEQAAAGRAQDEYTRASGDAARLKATLALSEKQHEDLILLDKRIADARSRLAELAAKRETMQRQRDEKQALAGALEAEVAELAARLAATEKSYDALARLAPLADLRTRVMRARELRELVTNARAAFTHEGLGAAAFKRIEELARDLETKTHQREAKAPQVSVRPGPDAQNRVRYQGKALKEPVQAAVTTPVRIEVDGIVSVAIDPVAVPTDARVIDAARAALDAELRKYDVTSLTEARARRDRGDAIAVEGRGLAAELKSIAPGSTEAEGVAALERELAAAEANSAAAGADGDALMPNEIAQRRTEAERHRNEYRARHAERNTALLAARSDFTAEDFRLTATHAELKREEAALAVDLAACPDDQRPQRLAALAAASESARRDFAAAQARADDLRARLPSDEQRAAIAARVKRCGDAIKARDEGLRRIENEIVALRERIATRGGDGVGERESALADELAVAERDLARIERRLAALRLLRDTIEASRSAARDAYLAPIKRAMKPFLHTLFPDADAAIDENFAVTTLQRAGEGAGEPFEYLSHGTREQIAVIVRLALGRLLAERGRPAPVVLDDALVFSDDERIESMFAALTEAAQMQQVIVLTCRTRAFQSLGGRTLAIKAG